VRALAYPLAVLIVAAACFAAVAVAAGAATWSRWVVRVGGAVGPAGVVLAAGAALNLFVPRTCAEAETAVGTVTARNRPAFSVVVDDGDCFRTGLAQVQVVALVVIATSAVVVVRNRATR
jgi:hypothetical protein